ncbi:hypothetical protein EDD96_5660 [Streptomyces sp. Ag109_G2-6]|uniref:hypothetical protein n=1 Tax=Streptomyces TaxID=1883 RepID=UPI000F506A0C|nr:MULTISPECIES: hypothetical protein [Streptomyces]RPF41835.1 hypothetical protein EDD96_5660 [Streptomyces sp. Ag109_G2-6]
MSDDIQTAAPSVEDALRSPRLLSRAEGAVMALFTTQAYELGWTVRSKLGGVLDHVTLSCVAGHSIQVTPVSALHPKLGSTIVQPPPGMVNVGPVGWPTALARCEPCARKRWEEAARASFPAYAIETDLRILADATSPSGYPANKVRCLHGHEFTVTAMDPRTPGRVPGITYDFTTGFDGADAPCVTCRGISQTPKLVEFRSRAREQSVMILDAMSNYVGQTVRLCCIAGHLTSASINAGLKRELLCVRCSGAAVRPEPTVYYVVTDEAIVKPGISSGDGRGRLDTHRSQHGLGQVRRLITDLPFGAAAMSRGTSWTAWPARAFVR